MAITATPKSIIALSIGLLAVAALFGALNVRKISSLRSNVIDANAAREAADRKRSDDQKGREAAITSAKATAAENEKKTANNMWVGCEVDEVVTRSELICDFLQGRAGKACCAEVAVGDAKIVVWR